MIILGIDPGSRKTGYGLVAKKANDYAVIGCGIINLEKIENPHEKLSVLFRAVSDLIAEHHPSAMAVERPFVGKNAQSAFKVGEARAVCILAAVESGMNVFEYTPRFVKQGITGYGAAQKEDVEAMVRRILGIQRKLQADAADALAIAIVHGNISTGLTAR